jgi:hypothetical protein
MKLIAKHTVKSGGKYHAPGAEFEVDDETAGGKLIAAGAAARKTITVVDDDDDEPMSVEELLAMSEAEGVTLKKFKAAAKKVLGDKTPSKKEDIVAALRALPPVQA